MGRTYRNSAEALDDDDDGKAIIANPLWKPKTLGDESNVVRAVQRQGTDSAPPPPRAERWALTGAATHRSLRGVGRWLRSMACVLQSSPSFINIVGKRDATLAAAGAAGPASTSFTSPLGGNPTNSVTMSSTS